MCVYRERERERVCVCVCVCKERERVCVCVCVGVCVYRERERECVCVCVCRERERESVCVCVCVCVERECVCVCVCVCTHRERKWVWVCARTCVRVYGRTHACRHGMGVCSANLFNSSLHRLTLWDSLTHGVALSVAQPFRWTSLPWGPSWTWRGARTTILGHLSPSGCESSTPAALPCTRGASGPRPTSWTLAALVSTASSSVQFHCSQRKCTLAAVYVRYIC